MRAIEYDRYGPVDVLVVRDVPRPTPGRGQILVRVRAAALNPKDALVRAGKMRPVSGFRFPKRVGFDWAGEVVELGSGVRGVTVGDRYFGMLGGFHGGACAEYLAASLDQCAPMPSTLDFEHAAAIPLAASTALQAIRDVARVRAGARVLVNGASGGVGLFAVQLAKLSGAQVTAVCGAEGLERCRRLGADVALDYRAADPLSGGVRFDVVFDVFGNRSLREARPALDPRGVYVTTVPSLRILRDAARTVFTWPRARLVIVRPRSRDLAFLSDRATAGTLVPVVARVFPLGRIAEAQELAASKHPGGKVIVRIN